MTQAVLAPMVACFAIGGIGVVTLFTETPPHEQSAWYRQHDPSAHHKEVMFIDAGDRSSRTYVAGDICIQWRSETSGVTWWGEFSNGHFECRHNNNCANVHYVYWKAPANTYAYVELKKARAQNGACPLITWY